jgi:hypothetical protein
VTIVPESPTHFNVLPYGPKGMTCTDRDGCGGVVQRGQCLSWKYESLLHVECDTVCADVMVVNIDIGYSGMSPAFCFFAPWVPFFEKEQSL